MEKQSRRKWVIGAVIGLVCISVLVLVVRASKPKPQPQAPPPLEVKWRGRTAGCSYSA